MKNLNKFTKHELISKLKNLDNQNSNQNSNKSTLIKIVEYLLYFKSLIFKLTLIAFIIRWIRKYSLVSKFWHIFNIIASVLLGFSLMDIYSLDIITWIKGTNIYNWYSDLLYPKEIIKDNKSSEFQFPKRITEKTTENETGHTRISEWINRNPKSKIEETKDDSIWDIIQNNSKAILIVSGVIIISGLSWYYFDEIKDGYFSSIEWIKNHFTKPSGGGQTGDTQSSSQCSITPTSSNIQVINNQTPTSTESVIQPPESSGSVDVKGKGVLTSPSLESLNNRAAESWAEGSSSPKSDSSSTTITPDKSSSTSSSSINTPLVNSFVINNWRHLITNNQEDFNFIEKTFASEDDLTKEAAEKLVKSLANLMVSYDDHILTYERVIKFKTEAQINAYYQTMYHFREWISIYHSKILPLSENKIAIGNMFDEPTPII